MLLGYVYAHQQRYKEAEDTLRRAEKIGTTNLWLYANLGELYVMQSKKEEAIASYRKAIDAPSTLKTYERARADAFEKLTQIYFADKNWKEADALLEQRVRKFPDNGCYKAKHADFRLRKLGNYESAITIATQALDLGCADDARPVLGMAYYAKWAALLKSGAKQREAEQDFNRGQAIYAQMPRLMYMLAGSDKTANVVSELKRRGIDIDTPDRDGFTALSFSLFNGDLDAARVLIGEGANVNKPINGEGFTPLMLAASKGNPDAVSLLLKNGADRRARTTSGYSAEAIAKYSGHQDVARLLSLDPGT